MARGMDIFDASEIPKEGNPARFMFPNQTPMVILLPTTDLPLYLQPPRVFVFR